MSRFISPDLAAPLPGLVASLDDGLEGDLVGNEVESALSVDAAGAEHRVVLDVVVLDLHDVIIGLVLLIALTREKEQDAETYY